MDAVIDWFRDVLLPYGGWGILAMAALDASFVPMPEVIDVAVMLAAGLRPELAWIYASVAVTGSTAGAACIYALARAGRGDRGGDRVRWAEKKIERHGAWALFVATLLPPPFPFKVVVLAAGFLRLRPVAFVAAVAAGRTIRFGSEAVVAALYGRRIVETVHDHAPAVGLVMAVVVIAALGSYLLLRRRFAGEG